MRQLNFTAPEHVCIILMVQGRGVQGALAFQRLCISKTFHRPKILLVVQRWLSLLILSIQTFTCWLQTHQINEVIQSKDSISSEICLIYFQDIF